MLRCTARPALPTGSSVHTAGVVEIDMCHLHRSRSGMVGTMTPAHDGCVRMRLLEGESLPAGRVRVGGGLHNTKNRTELCLHGVSSELHHP